MSTLRTLAFMALVCCGLTATAQGVKENRIVASPEFSKYTISRHIYGHFSEHLGHCIYGGYFVDENSTIPNTRRIRTDIVDALKKIHIPNLRWPGGCFADEYHWNDGIGLRANRPKMVNTHWGGVTEDNSFGTHEFLDLCEMLGTEPYICGNVGSGTVEEMSKWVEYLNFDGVSPMAELRKQNGHEKPWKVQFWGVGNENWGCGGNMTAEFYADQYRRYATYARNYGDAKLMKIAGGANSFDYHWTETLMKNVPLNMMWGVSLHYYTLAGGWDKKGSATTFGENEYFSAMKACLRMDELVTKHSTVMDRYDPEKRVALAVDEWGIWTDVEPGTNPGFLFQQNSLRDALIAASTLNIFNNHSDRVRMANLAQTVNVLQALILTDKEKMLLTPTYHVFDLYQVHQDAALIPLAVNTKDYVFGTEKLPALNASASRDKDGNIHLTIVNIDPANAIDLQVDVPGTQTLKASAQILTSDKFTDHNTFEKPSALKPVAFAGVKKTGESVGLKIPSKSLVVITLAK
ncbi:alpha-N-arabinofuranosidase [Chryseolinea serpens]|uniref:non-reducing end alpha-L-arabinofuranosidase n=1 Tax=Chryseolinea serpens TaxID=947013 RepID=A0A1M5QMB4_9BACT|nr:alpha-N-arabinofuranosidase [Chryseolinea serpens]SHH15255.1 alpha-N-arabinofuranosidase [Chryseolinea serpens]